MRPFEKLIAMMLVSSELDRDPNPTEVLACKRRQERYRIRTADLYSAIAIFLGFLLIVVSTLGDFEATRREFQAAGCGLAIAAVIARSLVHRMPRFGYPTFSFVESSVIGYFAYRLNADLAMQSTQAMASGVGLYVITPIALMLSPVSRRWVVPQGALYFMIALLVVVPFRGNTTSWLCGYATTVLLGVIFKYAWLKSIDREAISECRTLSVIAPIQIVRKSLETDTPPSVLFRAATRPTICISSDWRSYQALSRTLSPAELANLLAEYYAMVEPVLAVASPGGNYYFDWIADELFVVFYALSPEDERELPGQALRFARGLLAAKAAFSAARPAPRGIDVGIAKGPALVGMLGAQGLSKATAVGETAMRARKLQIVAKGLRATRGDADRIVIDAALAEAAPHESAEKLDEQSLLIA